MKSIRDDTLVLGDPKLSTHLITSTLVGCRFTGDYPGCEFGFRIDLHGKAKGTIRGSTNGTPISPRQVK